MLKEITIAIQSYGEAHRFIRTHRLWTWILLPGILYLLLFSFGIYYFVASSGNAVTWLSHWIGIERWLQQQHNEWLSFFFMMSILMLQVILFLFYFSLFKYFFLVIGAPIFAYLSEKTTALIEGRDYPFSFRQLAHDIFRGIKVAFRNTAWQTIYMFSLLLLSIIPVAGWIAPLIAIFVECYYFGFSMVDYSLERNGLNTSESIDFISKHKGLALGNGALFYAMHLVPLLGWMLAPAYAIIAATLSLHQIKKA